MTALNVLEKMTYLRIFAVTSCFPLLWILWCTLNRRRASGSLTASTEILGVTGIGPREGTGGGGVIRLELGRSSSACSRVLKSGWWYLECAPVVRLNCPNRPRPVVVGRAAIFRSGRSRALFSTWGRRRDILDFSSAYPGFSPIVGVVENSPRVLGIT